MYVYTTVYRDYSGYELSEWQTTLHRIVFFTLAEAISRSRSGYMQVHTGAVPKALTLNAHCNPGLLCRLQTVIIDIIDETGSNRYNFNIYQLYYKPNHIINQCIQIL